MKTLAGLALGFALMPAAVGLIVAFAWAGAHFKLSSVDTSLGAALGLATLVIGTLIAVKIWG